ncbi:disulfide bond formation protein B [Thioclava sp. BHET1]|nr:disulfide bond formation protein B [Thioclava sp. BHET1]
MSRRLPIFLATLGSAALLGGALAFQYIGGLLPCHLCMLQRYPHAAAIAIGIVALIFPARLLAILGALAALATSGVGLYHTGVERHWWEGPASCTTEMNIHGLSSADLLNKILAAPVARCDQAAWSFLDLSMASWNAIFSLILVFIWIAAAVRER